MIFRKTSISESFIFTLFRYISDSYIYDFSRQHESSTNGTINSCTLLIQKLSNIGSETRLSSLRNFDSEIRISEPNKKFPKTGLPDGFFRKVLVSEKVVLFRKSLINADVCHFSESCLLFGIYFRKFGDAILSSFWANYVWMCHIEFGCIFSNMVCLSNIIYIFEKCMFWSCLDLNIGFLWVW